MQSSFDVFIWITGFTHDGKVKIIDFGLACVVDVSSASSNETYQMSAETGSFRYMAPEVAQHNPYNEKVDVYSYGKSDSKDSKGDFNTNMLFIQSLLQV